MENENLNRTEEAWNLIARRDLHEEREILKKCESTGQVAGKKTSSSPSSLS